MVICLLAEQQIISCSGYVHCAGDSGSAPAYFSWRAVSLERVCLWRASNDFVDSAQPGSLWRPWPPCDDLWGRDGIAGIGQSALHRRHRHDCVAVTDKAAAGPTLAPPRLRDTTGSVRADRGGYQQDRCAVSAAQGTFLTMAPRRFEFTGRPGQALRRGSGPALRRSSGLAR